MHRKPKKPVCVIKKSLSLWKWSITVNRIVKRNKFGTIGSNEEPETMQSASGIGTDDI